MFTAVKAMNLKRKGKKGLNMEEISLHFNKLLNVGTRQLIQKRSVSELKSLE